MNVPTGRLRNLLALGIFAVGYISLTVFSYTRESATWDEPQFVLSGYLGWQADHRVVPEHPPLVQMWAALPLLAQPDIRVPAQGLPTTIDDRWLYNQQYFFTQDFFYKQNDADRLLYRSRFMIVLLGVGLGALLFFWARDLGGYWCGVAALALYCAEPNLSAHARLVTTDFGLTTFFCGTLYFLWRTTRELTWFNMSGLAAFFALAQVSKFTALLLGPIVFILLGWHACRGAPWKSRLGGRAEWATRGGKWLITGAIVCGLALTTWFAVWAAYGFRYAPAPAPAKPMMAMDSSLAAGKSPKVSKVLNWVDSHRLLPNLYTQGFLAGQLKAKERAAFLAGKYSTTGWWYFFPVAFLIKTPIVILILFLTGLVACVYWRPKWLATGMFLLIPVLIYFAVAIATSLNIGLRHLLPIYPLVLMIAAVAVAELMHRGRSWLLAGAVAAAALETAWVYPHYLAFFNALAGGPSNGHKYLVDSSLDWGQDLAGLKRWMSRYNVRQVGLSYFGVADPAYYQIKFTPLPGMPFYPDALVPELPGYIAVSVTNLRGVYLDDAGRAFYRPLLARRPVATIGHSIHIYWADQPWW